MAAPQRKNKFTQGDAIKALQVAEAVYKGVALNSEQISWLYGLLTRLADEQLTRRPKHRLADNSTRDFFAAMDYMMSNEKQKTVAKRWKLAPGTLGQIVRRNRAAVRKVQETSTATEASWLLVVSWHRDKTDVGSVTKGLRKP